MILMNLVWPPALQCWYSGLRCYTLPLFSCLNIVLWMVWATDLLLLLWWWGKMSNFSSRLSWFQPRSSRLRGSCGRHILPWALILAVSLFISATYLQTFSIFLVGKGPQFNITARGLFWSVTVLHGTLEALHQTSWSLSGPFFNTSLVREILPFPPPEVSASSLCW